MNQGPIVFLGIFFAVLVSWFGLIVQPQMQIGGALQGTNVLDKTSARRTPPPATTWIAPPWPSSAWLTRIGVPPTPTFPVSAWRVIAPPRFDERVLKLLVSTRKCPSM